MADDASATTTTPSPPTTAVAPTRIKRNTACTSCRDAKVRCNPSSSKSQPCQRCTKMHLTCVVDKTHKRVSRKSKLDELVQEIQSIKQTVGGSAPLPGYSQQPQPRPQPPQHGEMRPGLPSPAGTSSAAAIPAAVESSTMAPSPGLQTPVTITTLPQDPAVEPSLPRALGSRPFSGEDIDYYFQKYFECYHPYMPVVRQRDPNRVYESGPVLFWAVVFVASRRYGRNPTVLPFLMDEVRRELHAALAAPLSMPVVNAFLLVCAWCFPDVRFVNDPTALFSSAIGNAALLLGIHTGKGAHPEYSVGPFQNNFTDEEAAYTWAGYNIISQRVSSYLGLPPLGGLFNQTVQNIIDGRTPFQVPPGFRVLLECQKFCNHVSKTMMACLEESRGVSAHVVRLLEDEWSIVAGLVCSERADPIDSFNALLVQLEIQMYYMLPLPGYDPSALKRNILRAYTTAQAVIRDALALDRMTDFVAHITHFYFRALLAASCVVYKILRSSYMALDIVDRKAAEQSAADAVALCRRATVMEADLPARLGTLMESWFELSQAYPAARWHEEPVSSFSHRLGASVSLDCLMRWKTDQHLVNLSISNTVNGVGGGGGGNGNNGSSNNSGSCGGQATDTTTSAAVGVDGAAVNPMVLGAEPLQNIDWSFMDDIDWNFEPGILGAPA
ncbi:hypothetical protein F4775DRAFT_225647 [Biscogniauxia sp. FL1348]|nr:hypothetical protein F4775DRAFT_225647 [Biscogniauxia sp. FL1348]